MRKELLQVASSVLHGDVYLTKESNVVPQDGYCLLLFRTRNALKISSSNETPKQVLDKVYSSVGDGTKTRTIGQLPRGPTDLYNARFSLK